MRFQGFLLNRKTFDSVTDHLLLMNSGMPRLISRDHGLSDLGQSDKEGYQFSFCLKAGRSPGLSHKLISNSAGQAPATGFAQTPHACRHETCSRHYERRIPFSEVLKSESFLENQTESLPVQEYTGSLSRAKAIRLPSRAIISLDCRCHDDRIPSGSSLFLSCFLFIKKLSWSR